jgi:hypothetical protein
MIGLLIIATTLLTRGVSNMQEMALLVMAPHASLVNYTYHYIESTGFNYTNFVRTIPSMPKDFSFESWMNPTTMSSMRNSTQYWMKEMPAMATELPMQMYERMRSAQPRYAAQKMDLQMLFLSMYVTTLFMMATVIWVFQPGSSKSTSRDVFDTDNILARKRKRTPQMEERMQLRSMTTDEDVFYELK